MRWFHTGGSHGRAEREAATAVVLEAMQAAKRHGTVVSFDCNYRPSLWKSRGGRQGSVEVNRSLMPFVDVLFGHEGDVAATLGPRRTGRCGIRSKASRPMAAARGRRVP